MRSVLTVVFILLTSAAWTAGQSPGGDAAQPGKGQPLVENYTQLMVTPPPAELGLDPFYKRYSDAFGVPADIYYGRNIKPAPRRQ